MSVFDWDAVKTESRFPVYPDGSYLVKIEGVAFMVNNTNNNNMAKWLGVIVGGEFSGQPISTITAITDKAMWKIKMLLSACGVDPDERHKKTELMSIAFKNLLQMACEKSCLWDVTQRKNPKGYLVNDVNGFRAAATAVTTEEQPPEEPSGINWEN